MKTQVCMKPASVLLLAGPQPAFAEVTTFTQTFDNETFPIFDPLNPCSPGIGTGVVNGVVHLTEVGDGPIHTAITLTGSFEVIDLNSGQNATGHFTFREGQNVNFAGQVRNSQTFILSVNGEMKMGLCFTSTSSGSCAKWMGYPLSTSSRQIAISYPR